MHRMLSVLSSLTAALNSICQEPYNKLSNALSGGEGFDSTVFRKTALLLLNATAVPISELELAISVDGDDPKKAREVMLAMLKQNVISIRPYSKWALDFPENAWPCTTLEKVCVFVYLWNQHVSCLVSL